MTENLEIGRITIIRALTEGHDAITVDAVDGDGQPLQLIAALGLLEYGRIDLTADAIRDMPPNDR